MKKPRILVLVLFVSSVYGFSLARAEARPELPVADIEQNCSNEASAGSTEETTIDLVLLIDQSNSLKQSLPSDSGKLKIEFLEEALRKIKPLLISSERLRIAVITFAADARIVRNLNESPMTPSDYEQFVERVSDTESLRGGTNYIDAVTAATDQFRNYSDAANCRVLLWFTDGEVDLRGRDDDEDGRTLLESFCGGNTPPNQSDQLSRLNVLSFVILLSNDAFTTMGEVPQSQQRRQDSIVGLRGITGDWTEIGEPNLTPQAPCDDEKTSRQGEVIKVDDFDSLIKQILEFVIRGTTDSDYCPTETLAMTDMPSGQLFDFIVINVVGAGTLDEPKVLAGRSFPIVLDRSNDADARTLDSLARGWDVTPGSSASYLCLGYRLRSGITFEAKAKNNTLRVGDNCAKGSDYVEAAIISYGGLERGQSFTGLQSRDPRIQVGDNDELRIGADCKDRQLSDFQNALRLTDNELGGDGREILENKNLFVDLRLSQTVTITGKEGIPRLVCDDLNDLGEFELKISHRNQEVSEGRYRASSTCRFENAGKEDGTIRFVIEPKMEIGNNNVEIVPIDQDSGEGVLEVENSSDLQSRSFGVGTLKSLTNEEYDILTVGSLVVIFDDGYAPFEIGKVEVVVELNLLARSNPFWALVAALVASVVAMVLSYLFLHRILRQTASLGAHGSVSAVTTAAEFEISSDGSKSVRWLGSESFKPRIADAEIVILHNDDATRVGRLKLRARIGRLNQPALMLREPWAEVTTDDSQVTLVLASPSASYSYSRQQPRFCSTRAPLRQCVVLELFSAVNEMGPRRGRLTFIVRNRGNLEEQINILKRDVNSLAKRAISEEQTSRAQSRQDITRSETSGVSVEETPHQELKRPPR
jgi:hypothetical protein